MGNPDGGWYDDTPPSVISSTPADRGTGVKGHRVVINFDEFIKLEDAQNKVIVSPPQIEAADIKASGKRIIVDLKDSLKENTTYTIDFSDAISDNNEGNPMGNYTFSFSTGSQIDTFEVSGYALDASNLEPIKGILVGLYQEPDSGEFADSVFHHTPMMRVSRTNGSGRFAVKGVAPGRYRAFALQDADGDFVYGQKSETIGFLTDIITPSAKPDVRQDTVWRDTLHIDNILRVGYTHFLPDDVTLLCFQAPQTDRYLVKTERKEPDRIEFFFSYGCDSLPRITGLNFDADSAFILESSLRHDTLCYWLRDTALVHQDTLRMMVSYLMTDSAGMLVEHTDSSYEAIAKVPYAKRLKEQERELEKWMKEQEKKKKKGHPYDSIPPVTPLKPRISASGSITPSEVIYFNMPFPLAHCDTAAIHLNSKIDTLWIETPYEFRQVSTRSYALQAEWQLGTEYRLEVDSGAFISIYGRTSDAIKQGLKVRTEDEFSTLIVNMRGVADTTSVIVQVLDGSDKVSRQALAQDGTAEFYYLKPGRYFLRAFEDWNHNGQWDTGDYDAGLQAEPVYYFHEAVECKAKWDINRDFRVNARPRYQQKPAAITKQKPDKEKQLRNRNAQRAKEKGILYLNNNLPIRK